MSFDDDATDDHAGFRPPPHPDDRLWRHPSELLGSRRGLAAPNTDSRARTHHRWGTVAVAGAGVALVAAGASVMTIGLKERAAEQGPVQQAVISPLGREPAAFDYVVGPHEEPDQTQLDLARELAPSVVRVDTGEKRGSGVVVSDNGVLVTSSDVVEESDYVAVALADGRLLTGETVGIDVLTGLAVVDLPGDGYAAASTADPSTAWTGGTAFALGVDGSGRVVIDRGELASAPSSVERAGLTVLDGVLVLDTVTHPSARGGPVVDDDGNLLGLTTWTDATQSYATPIDATRKVVDDLLTTGKAQHTWLGIVGSNAAGVDGPAGVGIADVMVDGPCVSILLPGDRIVAIGDQPVSNMSALVAELRLHDPGDEVPLTYWRRDRRIIAIESVVLAERPDDLD